MSEAIWIKNGRIIDPANGRNEVADLYIADGRICEVPAGKESEVANVVDASGKIVAPGFIDLWGLPVRTQARSQNDNL